jgi:molecular chaperone IbpA
MRTFDLSPLYRNTVGFDRLFKMVDQLADPQQNSYPPYNIERLNENDYRISIAVAGFTDQDLSIESKENSLIVRGEKKVEESTDKPEYLYQGIAARAFERRFQLADHVLVNGARLENGLLHIELHREIPEAKKPRAVPITTSGAKTIETTAEQKAAA